MVLKTYYVHYDTHVTLCSTKKLGSAVLNKIDSKILSLINRLSILTIDPKRFVNQKNNDFDVL